MSGRPEQRLIEGRFVRIVPNGSGTFVGRAYWVMDALRDERLGVVYRFRHVVTDPTTGRVRAHWGWASMTRQFACHPTRHAAIVELLRRHRRR